MSRAPFRLFACPFQSVLNFILLDHLATTTLKASGGDLRFYFFLPLVVVGNYEFAIHPRRTSDKFDPSRLREAARWRCQRFIIRSVVPNLIPPTSLCVTRIPGQPSVCPYGCSGVDAVGYG